MAWTREDLEGLAPDTEALCVKAKDLRVEDLARIARLPKLEALNLSEAQGVTNEGLEVLSTLGCLKTLSISLAGVTAKGLGHLSLLPELTHLAAYRCEGLTDEGFTAFGRIRTLKSLFLWGCGQATDEGVAQLAGLTRLESLTLAWSKAITGRTLGALSGARGLRVLDLTSLPLSPEGVATFALLPGLRDLEISVCAIGDAHLRELGVLRDLETLKIAGDNRAPMSVTDTGLASLRGLERLRSFHIYEAGVTAPAMRKLANALPGIYLVR